MHRGWFLVPGSGLRLASESRPFDPSAGAPLGAPDDENTTDPQAAVSESNPFEEPGSACRCDQAIEAGADNRRRLQARRLAGPFRDEGRGASPALGKTIAVAG